LFLVLLREVGKVPACTIVGCHNKVKYAEDDANPVVVKKNNGNAEQNEKEDEMRR